MSIPRSNPRRAEEGMVIGIPLPRRGGFGQVVVARAGKIEGRGPRLVIVYGFGPSLRELPERVDDAALQPQRAAVVEFAMDQDWRSGSWKSLGYIANFTHSRWPVPPFKRWDRLAKVFRRSVVGEDLRWVGGDLVEISDEEAAGLPWEGLSGPDALPYALDDAIDAQARGVPYVPLGPDRPPPGRVLMRK